MSVKEIIDMNWYKKAKFYGNTIPPALPDAEEKPQYVYVTLKDGTKKQVKDVMLVPETNSTFNGKDNIEKEWMGWGVANNRDGKGWETKKWFLNHWEAEEYAQKKYPKG